MLPSSEAGPSGFGSPPVLLSPCDNSLLRRFPTSLSHLAKAERPGRGTQRSGQAGERVEEEGE
jgi:hypothetical protein